MTSDDRLAFRGQWVQRPGGIRVPVVEDHDADEVGDMLIGVLTRILKHLPPPQLVSHTCPDCGCLLRVPNELCPACAIAWCREQEIRDSWRTVHHYRPNEKGAAA